MKIYTANTLQPFFIKMLSNNEPSAYAEIIGNEMNENLYGMAYFYQIPSAGLLIEVEVYGLPNMDTMNSHNFYGMHIHEKGDCTRPFDMTGEHYNPDHTSHPKHAGDLPPLLGNEGYAYTLFYTDKFKLNDIFDRSLIIHNNPDDFTTQPSGNSGVKIGCGVIKEIKNDHTMNNTNNNSDDFMRNNFDNNLNGSMNNNMDYSMNRSINDNMGYSRNQSMNNSMDYPMNRNTNNNTDYSRNRNMNDNTGYSRNRNMNDNTDYSRNRNMNENMDYDNNNHNNSNAT